MQQRPTGPLAVGILFDCDMGNSIDDALAMALLYGLEGKNELRVSTVTISKPNLKAAELAEAIGRFYAGEVSGAFNAQGRTLPIGLATEGKRPEDTPMLTVPLAKRTPEGKPVYNHGIAEITDTAEPLWVIRNSLVSQFPQNAVMVVTGPLSNLAPLLDKPALKALVAEKIRMLVIAGGSFPDGKPEASIQADVAIAKRVFAEWPTPIVAAGAEVGEALRFPAASIAKDFAWSPAHPVVDAYLAYQPMPYDAPSTAMAAILHAVRTKENYFQLSAPGTITVLDNGGAKHTPSPEGKHRYLIVDPAQKDKVLQVYTELASAKPVPRAPRVRFNQQQQQPVTPPPKPVLPEK